MKILNKKLQCYTQIEMDDGSLYRRFSEHYWEKLYGDTWEPHDGFVSGEEKLYQDSIERINLPEDYIVLG